MSGPEPEVPGTGPPPPPPPPPPRRNEARSWVIFVVLGLAVAYLIAFAVENTTSVSVHWVFGTTHGSLIWVIFVSLFLGAVVGLLGARLYRRRSRRPESRDS